MTTAQTDKLQRRLLYGSSRKTWFRTISTEVHFCVTFCTKHFLVILHQVYSSTWIGFFPVRAIKADTPSLHGHVSTNVQTAVRPLSLDFFHPNTIKPKSSHNFRRSIVFEQFRSLVHDPEHLVVRKYQFRLPGHPYTGHCSSQAEVLR